MFNLKNHPQQIMLIVKDGSQCVRKLGIQAKPVSTFMQPQSKRCVLTMVQFLVLYRGIL